MFQKSYSNFVKASTSVPSPNNASYTVQLISGNEAQQYYLEEIKDANEKYISRQKSSFQNTPITERRKRISEDRNEVVPANKDLFIIAQNDDVDKLKAILDKYPDKITVIDDYGWSLLMIACQANSIRTAQELLKRGIDISIRDKAGNSARSLVIKNKNYELANILLSYIQIESNSSPSQTKNKFKSKTKDINHEFTCKVCNKTYPNGDEHLSSTLHNICASTGKKIPANYIIPQTNKGYQLMLKVGWDRDSGLGKDGSGKKYPIKAIPKKDRKGLGHGKLKEENSKQDNIKHITRKRTASDYYKSRSFEINFRREFY